MPRNFPFGLAFGWGRISEAESGCNPTRLLTTNPPSEEVGVMAVRNLRFRRAHVNPFTDLTINRSSIFIPLSKGLWAIIDLRDFPAVNEMGWCAHRCHPDYDEYYARADCKKFRGFLHNFLIRPPEGMIVDHVNGRRLDNRRSNLRLATNHQNACNWPRKNRIGFRGLARQRNGNFTATISTKAGRIGLGTYRTAEEAARAYDAAAKVHHGEFALLNFPDVRKAG